MSFFTSKRLLQGAVIVGGAVPVGAGLAGALAGPAMVPGLDSWTASFDSHYRYLSGLLLGIGLVFWSLVPHIQNNGKAFRFLTFIVFAGGLARLYSLLTIGAPGPPMLFGLGMELVVTPALAYWQFRVAHHVNRLI